MYARLVDLYAHANTKKHVKSSETFSSAQQTKLPFYSVLNDTQLKI